MPQTDNTLHTPLHVASLVDLHGCVLSVQAHGKVALGYRALGLLGLLTLACTLPPVGAKAAGCLAVFAALSIVTGLVQFVARDMFLHAME